MSYRTRIYIFTAFVVTIIIVSMIILASINNVHASPKQSLIEAGHRVLDLGYDCAKSGAERGACHTRLTAAISAFFHGG